MSRTDAPGQLERSGPGALQCVPVFGAAEPAQSVDIKNNFVDIKNNFPMLLCWVVQTSQYRSIGKSVLT